MKKIILSMVAVTMLSGCSNNLQRFEDVDRKEKTVLVPVGNIGLKGYLKDAMRSDGFELFIKSDNKDLAYVKPDLARYDLIFEEKWLGSDIFTKKDKYRFSISLVNLKTDKEVFIYYGFDWSDKIVENFKRILNNKSLIKSRFFRTKSDEDSLN